MSPHRVNTPARVLRRLEGALEWIEPNSRRPEISVRARADLVFEHLRKSRAAVLIANDAGRYVVVNAAASRLTGYSRPVLLNMSVWDLTPGVRQALGRRLWRDFQKRGRMSGVYVIQRRDGRRVKARYAAVANVLPGIHVSVLARDRRA